MTFDAKFNDVNPDAGGFNYTARGVGHSSLGGRMMWNSTSTLHDAFAGLNGQTGNNFITFCIEVAAPVNFGNTYKIETQQLKDLPTSGSPAPMNAAKANDVAQFWGKWKTEIKNLQSNTGFMSYSAAQLGSAIQLAIWEIVFEKDNTAYNVTSEGGSEQGFKVTSGDAGALTLAQYLLDHTDFSDANTNLANVVGLKVTQSGADRQDQVTIIDDDYVVTPGGNIEQVPVPPAVVLVAAGIASGLFLRRRIAGQQAAVVA
ncbi:MAG: hypothetical protein ABGY75_18210 [Gemmataceae bacterium]